MGEKERKDRCRVLTAKKNGADRKKQKKIDVRKRRRFLLVSVILCAAAVIAAVSVILWQTLVVGNDVVVMTVNGLPVTREELRFHMDMVKGEVSNYFYQTHNVSVTDWSKAYGGESPADMLRERAKQSAVDFKVLQGLAVQYGIASDTSFSGMKAEMDRVNEERRQREASGDPTMYGVVQFNLVSFYSNTKSYYTSNLKELVENVEVFVDEQKLRDFYEENYETNYHRNKYAKVSLMLISYLPDGEEPTETVSIYQDEAYALIQDIHERLLEGADFDQLCLEYTGFAPEEFDVDLSDIGQSVQSSLGRISTMAAELSPGEISDPFENGSSVAIVKLLENNLERDMTYDEAYDGLYFEEYRQNFEAFLARKSEEADVVKSSFIFDRVNP